MKVFSELSGLNGLRMWFSKSLRSSFSRDTASHRGTQTWGGGRERREGRKEGEAHFSGVGRCFLMGGGAPKDKELNFQHKTYLESFGKDFGDQKWEGG